jgi:hypothetical protein
MAAGFKTAQVNASDVPATQTNFPAYVDLSRLGITTLAEAESVRVYADSAKTTEWAREIVSATEMHVKVPSLTSTVAMYVDWDGVRADYATTDTYGRNAVWSDYAFVFHMENDGTDSTGGGTATATGTVTFPSGSPMGESSDTSDSANNYLQGGGNFADGTADKSISMWAVSDNRTKRAWYVDTSDITFDSGTFFRRALGFYQDASTLYFYGYGGDPSLGSMPSNGTNFHAVATYNNSTPILRTYLNGAAQGTDSNTFNHLQNSGGVRLHIRNMDLANSRLDGRLNDVRGYNGVYSANWITTEYNNQSDEAGFWGTWSTVGGKRGAIAAFF